MHASETQETGHEARPFFAERNTIKAIPLAIWGRSGAERGPKLCTVGALARLPQQNARPASEGLKLGGEG